LFLFDVLAAPPDFRGAAAPHAKRYELLKEYTAGLHAGSAFGFIAIKDFLPASQIRSLVSTVPPFPVDGIVFQHKGVYKVPQDPRLHKWKPQDQCSVDFRLSRGYEDEALAVWIFIPICLRIADSGSGLTDCAFQ
jgi:hypothetical protein